MNTTNNVSLGILDTGILIGGTTPSQGLVDTLHCAQKAESLGYIRYWLSEHHDAHYAWTRPSMVLPYLGAHTSQIRLGTAAILLGLYAPLQVAEDFRVLQAMFPGRIDYGVCSASPLHPEVRAALLDGQQDTMQEVAGQFEQKLSQMQTYLHNTFPKGHVFQNGATPRIPPGDCTWLMGTGKGSMTIAAKMGIAYSYSLFHRHSREDREIILEYPSLFVPRYPDHRPTSNIAVSVICAETDLEAQQQKDWVESVQADFRVNVYGSAETCHAMINELCMQYKTNEVIVFMMWHEQSARLRGFEMLAQAFFH